MGMRTGTGLQCRAGLDIEALRKATPGCQPDCGVHFHHGGSSLPSAKTLAVIFDYMSREARYGPMETAAGAQGELGLARAEAAALIGATVEEVAFTSGGSEAWGLAFAGLPPLKPGDRILVGQHEWGGNLSTMKMAAARAGASIEHIPCRADGSVSPDALTELIDDRVKLISLTWLPANGGLVNDAGAIGQVARAAGVPFFLDAAQALGQMTTDVQELKCDILASAGRKHLRGPRGTGLLYVRSAFRKHLTPAFVDTVSAPWSEGPVRLRQDARVLEGQEMPPALVLGLGNALAEARGIGIAAIQMRIATLADMLRDALSQVQGVTLRDLGTQRSGLVSFTVAGLEPPEVRTRLAAMNIRIGANGPAYTPLDLARRKLPGVARASISYLNTEAELQTLVTAVASLASQAR